MTTTSCLLGGCVRPCNDIEVKNIYWDITRTQSRKSKLKPGLIRLTLDFSTKDTSTRIYWDITVILPKISDNPRRE